MPFTTSGDPVKDMILESLSSNFVVGESRRPFSRLYKLQPKARGKFQQLDCYSNCEKKGKYPQSSSLRPKYHGCKYSVLRWIGSKAERSRRAASAAEGSNRLYCQNVAEKSLQRHSGKY